MGRRGGPRGPYRLGDEDDEDAPGVLTPRAQAIAATVARLEGDGRVKAAALIGQTFGLDPVTILSEPDDLKALVRLAAHNIIQTETAKAQRRHP